MNHGAPAARIGVSGWSGSKMRSAPRSSAERASAAVSPAWLASTPGSAARQLERLAVEVDEHLDADVPRARGWDRRAPRDEAGLEDRGLVARDLHAAAAVTVALREPQVPDADLLTELALAVRTPLLHGEQVGEVDVAAELEHHRSRLHRVVGDHDALAHPCADAAVAEHDHVGVGTACRRVGAPHEGGLVRLHYVDRERLEDVAVDAQLPQRDHARVEDEQPVWVVGGQVTRAPRQAERLALDQRDHTAGAAERRDRRPALVRRRHLVHRRTSHQVSGPPRGHRPVPSNRGGHSAPPQARCDSPAETRGHSSPRRPTIDALLLTVTVTVASQAAQHGTFQSASSQGRNQAGVPSEVSSKKAAIAGRLPMKPSHRQPGHREETSNVSVPSTLTDLGFDVLGGGTGLD
jgi:hypothetical protein